MESFKIFRKQIKINEIPVENTVQMEYLFSALHNTSLYLVWISRVIVVGGGRGRERSKPFRKMNLFVDLCAQLTVISLINHLDREGRWIGRVGREGTPLCSILATSPSNEYRILLDLTFCQHLISPRYRMYYESLCRENKLWLFGRMNTPSS